MTAGVVAETMAPGAGGVGHAPGWKHPIPTMVTVDETVNSGVSICIINAG